MLMLRSILLTVWCLAVTGPALIYKVSGESEPTAPLLPLQLSVETSETASVAPALTTYWSIAAVDVMVFAVPLSTASTSPTPNNVSAVATWSFNTTAAVTYLVAGATRESVLVIAGGNIYFLNSNATAVWIVATVSASSGQSFDPFSADSMPVVQNKIVYIGTSDVSGQSPVFYALNGTTGVELWRFSFNSIRYANMRAVVDQSLNRICAQGSKSGSDSVMYVLRLDGTNTDLQMQSTDSPANRGAFLSTGLYTAVMFAVSFYDLTNSSAPKIGGVTYSNLFCSMLEPVRTPILVYNGVVYSTCLENIFGVSSSTYALASTVKEPNSVAFSMGVAAPGVSPPVAFFVTEKAALYRFNANTQQLTLIYQEPYVPRSGFALQSVRLYWPIANSNDVSIFGANAFVLVAFRLSSTLGTVRAADPWTGSLLWSITDRGLASAAVSNGNFTAVSQSLADATTGRFSPLRLYGAVPLISQNITTATSPTVATAFTSSPARTDILGVLALPPGSTQGSISVHPDGIYRNLRDSSVKICPYSSNITSLAAPPVVVSSRWVVQRNVTYNVTVLTNQTVNVTTSNTSLQNVTIVVNATYNYTQQQNVTTNTTSQVNQTVNVTQTRWRIDNTTVGSPSACVLDHLFRLVCYNLSTSVCSAPVQLCDGGGMLSSNRLRTLHSTTGQILWFCSGSADRAFDLFDVTTSVLTKFGTAAGGGVVGAWSSSLRYAIVAVATTSTPANDRRRWVYRLERYNFSSTTAVWSTSINVPVLSNLALVEANANVTNNGAANSAVVYFVSYSLVRYQQTLVSVFALTGVPTYQSTDVLGRRNSPFLLNMVPESSYWIHAVRLNGDYTYCYIVGGFVLQVINGTIPLTERMLLTAQTLIRGASVDYPYGPFTVQQTSPLLAADLGALVVPATNATLSINMFSGSLLWASSGAPKSNSHLLRQDRSVATSSDGNVQVYDIVTGQMYMSLGTMLPEAESSPPPVSMWSIEGPSSGVVVSGTTPFVVTARSSDALFTSLARWWNASTIIASGVFVPRPFHTETPSQTQSPSGSLSLQPTDTAVPSRSHTLTEEITFSQSAEPSETYNPFGPTRTPIPTQSARLSASRTMVLSASPRLSSTHSLPVPVPTRTPSNTTAATATLSVTLTLNESESSSLSFTKTEEWTQTESASFTFQLSKSDSVSITVSTSDETTVSLTPPPTRTPRLTPTMELMPTATRHTNTPIPDDPIIPAAAPNVISESDYSFIIGPAVALAVLAAVLTFAILAKKRRAKKKAERILKEEQERREREQEMNQYEPPPAPGESMA